MIVIFMITYFFQPVPDTSVPIKVAIIEDFAPCVIPDGNSYKGMDIQLWERLCEDKSVPYVYIPMELREALHAVEQGEVDVALGGITITAARETIIDFSQPYVEAGLRLLVRENKDLSYKDLFQRILNTPSIYQILLTLMVFLIICAHVVWIIERRASSDVFPRSYFSGVLNASYYVFICITTVGFGDKVCRQGIGKLVTCIIIFVGLIFYGSIMGSFAAAFTQAYEHRYPALNDVPSIATKQGSTADHYLSREYRGEIQRYASIDDAYTALKKGDVGGVVFDGPNVVYNAQNYMITPTHFTKEVYGIAINPKLSELRESINQSLLKLHESGELDQIRMKWLEQ